MHVNVRPFKAEIDEEDSDFIAHEDDEDEDEENKGVKLTMALVMVVRKWKRY